MPDKNCEVFTKVLATLSESVVELITGDKKEFLNNQLKQTNVEVMTHLEENVTYLIGSLESINLSQKILSKKLLTVKNNATTSDGVTIDQSQHILPRKLLADNATTQDEINKEVTKIHVDESASASPQEVQKKLKDSEESETHIEVQNEMSKLKGDSLSEHAVIETQTKDCESLDEDKMEYEGSNEVKVEHITKSGRVVKAPLKLSSDANVIDKDGDGYESDENVGKVKYRNKRKRGRPRKLPRKPFEDVAAQRDLTKSKFLNKNKNDIKPTGPSAPSATQSGNVSADMKFIKKYYEDKLPYKFFCQICSFKTKRESHFTIHMDLHKKNPNLKLHTCNKCDFTSMRLGVLQRHKMTHMLDSKELYSCSHCNFTTCFQKCMTKHESKHLKRTDTNYECNFCNFTTTTKIQYSKHLLNHSDSDSKDVFKCPKCEYQTKRRINFLRHHRDKHTEIRPHLCDLCGAAFKRSDALTAHKESHIEKSLRTLPYPCKICHKGFRTPAHLLEHSAVHSTERSFQCHVCGQMFKTKAVQQKHLRGVHHKQHVNQCSICQKFFSSKYTLKRHLRQHDGENLPEDGQIKTIQTLLPEGQDGEFVGGQGQIDADEDANAIQTITISSENINDLNQKLQNLSSQIQNMGEMSDVYIQGLENENGDTVSIVNLNGDDIGHILIPTSESEYTEQVEQLTAEPVTHLTVSDTTTVHSMDTNQQVNSDSVKLFHTLQQQQGGQVIASSSAGPNPNLSNDSSLNIQLLSINKDLSSQLRSEIVANSNLVNSVPGQVQETIQESIDVPSSQLLDLQEQIITDDGVGQIVEVVTPDGNTYHLKVNNGWKFS